MEERERGLIDFATEKESIEIQYNPPWNLKKCNLPRILWEVHYNASGLRYFPFIRANSR